MRGGLVVQQMDAIWDAGKTNPGKKRKYRWKRVP